MRLTKVNKHVAFPLELDIGAYCYAPKGCRYRLVGIVSHSGGMGGGHYVSYGRPRGRGGAGRATGKKKGGAGGWRYVSDSHVSPVSTDQVLGKQAYLLFYERIEEEDPRISTQG